MNMKKIMMIATALLLSLAAFAQDGKGIYEKYSGFDGVSGVYISPAMFRLMGRLPEMQLSGEDMDLASVMKSFNGLYLIDSEDERVNESLKADVENAVRKGKYELLLETKDSGDIVRLYTLGEDIVKSFIFFTVSGRECTFISIDGQIRMEDLMKVVAK